MSPTVTAGDDGGRPHRAAVKRSTASRHRRSLTPCPMVAIVTESAAASALMTSVSTGSEATTSDCAATRMTLIDQPVNAALPREA